MTLRPSRHPAGTLGRIVDEGTDRLLKAGVDTARLDARVLAARYLGQPSEFALVHPEAPVGDADRNAIGLLFARRENREPMSLILGEREFWSMAFTVNRAVFTPRPETETVVDAALTWLADAGRRNAPIRILDLGTGTGCLLVALLSELPNATGMGVDISGVAAATARENAARLGFTGRAQFAQAGWAYGVTGPFDLIVSNPPYIATGDRDSLPPEVRDHDPAAALYAGADGLDAYRAIAPRAAKLLAPLGALVLELGQGQADQVRAIVGESGFETASVKVDLAGISRALVAVPQGV
ncbi:MAG: peptide chain release factor N(5)-glutamine methyltransferase [Rhodospirillaceae bacterium]